MRTSARECAYKIIFSGLFHPSDDSLKRSVYKNFELSDEDKSYAERLIETVNGHSDELCEIIDKYAIGFSHARMFPADKSALLIALAEIVYFDDVPDVVAVDEAVGLVKRYSTEKSMGFINGILAAYLADKKKGETTV